MKNSFILFFLLFSLLSQAQKDYELIDHTLQQNSFSAIHLTDSVIYYSPNRIQDFFGVSTFSSIDSNGVYTETLIYEGNSLCKFISGGEHHLDAFYYELMEEDILWSGLYQYTLSNGQGELVFRDIPLEPFVASDIEYFQSDIIVLGYDFIAFYNEQDQLANSIDIDILNQAYFVRDANKPFLVLDESIYAIQNQSIIPLYTSSDPLFQVLGTVQDELILVFDEEVKSLRTSDLVVSDLFDYSLPYKKLISMNEDGSFLVSTENLDNHRIVKMDSDGSTAEIYTLEEGENFNNFSLKGNQLFLNGTRKYEATDHVFFKKTSIDGTNEPAHCLDIELKFAEIKHVDKEFLFSSPTPNGDEDWYAYTYTYDVVVENHSNLPIDRVDVYSEEFYVGGFFWNSSLHFTVTDIPADDIVIQNGEFEYVTPAGIIVPEYLYLSGGDYFLDCDYSNNVFDVTEILSSNQEMVSESAIRIHPNPASNEIIVSGSNLFDSYIIYSADGRKWKEGKLTEIIDVSDLTGGLYILRMGDQMTRFLKEY